MTGMELGREHRRERFEHCWGLGLFKIQRLQEKEIEKLGREDIMGHKKEYVMNMYRRVQDGTTLTLYVEQQGYLSRPELKDLGERILRYYEKEEDVT